METILITGGSGFLGTALTPKLLTKGHKIYSLSRHPPEKAKNLIPLVGDVTMKDLGLKKVPQDIDAVHHLAAIHRLGEDKDGSIEYTNIEGTKNVINFCARYGIPHLYHCSTAYTMGRNPYEVSKATCEMLVEKSDIPRVTTFKPSIIMGTKQHFYPGHFSQFVILTVKLHQRAEIIRRRVEGTLRLPVIEPVFRVKGNPGSFLNLVQIDQVADAMADIKEPGCYWLTNPNPSTLKQLTEWIGEYIMVRMEIKPNFKATPIEAMFQKLGAAFVPYCEGDDFPSNLKGCPPITKEFIQDTIRMALLHRA